MRASSSLLVNFNSAACILLRFFLIVATSSSRTASTTSSIVVDAAVNGSGTQTVLVVSTKSPGDGGIGNSKSEQEMSTMMFGSDGNGGGGISVKSFYNTCSHGKLNLVKAPDNPGIPNNSTISIKNGATTVTLNTVPTNNDYLSAIIEELKRQFNVTDHHALADHIVHCLPPAVSSWSFAQNGHVTLGDPRCLDPLVSAHEFGHSIGIHHSRQSGSTEDIGKYDKEEYGDETCTMGHAFLKNQALSEGKGLDPSHQALPVCFNGAKSWTLGWYQDKHVTFTAVDQKWEGKLIGQVDYPTSSNGSGVVYTVVLKLQYITPGATFDYYVMFHRVPGNETYSSNYDNANKVSIVGMNRGGSTVTNLDKVLGTGESWTKPEFNGQGQDLKVTVKSIKVDQTPAFAEVVVEILGQPTSGPTSPPTSDPTTEPTTSSTSAAPTKSIQTTPPTKSIPMTATPSSAPTKSIMTAAPTTSAPSSMPVTMSGTSLPTKISPPTGVQDDSKSSKSQVNKSKSSKSKGRRGTTTNNE